MVTQREHICGGPSSHLLRMLLFDCDEKTKDDMELNQACFQHAVSLDGCH